MDDDSKFELSEETMIIFNKDGTATLEVLYEDDIAAILLTAIEVARLREALNRQSNKAV